MNKNRREELLDVASILDDAIDRLSEIRDDEQDAFDSLPDSLQDSVRGQAMLEAIDQLDGFENLIDGARQQIENYAKPKKKKK